MTARPANPLVAASLCNRLTRQIAERHPAALSRLHRLLVRQIFARARIRLGHAEAVSVTCAVFVEVWWLAPVSRAHHDDALAWLLAIADRRIAERVRAMGEAPPPAGHYDEHLDRELRELLGPAGAPARASSIRRTVKACRPVSGGPRAI